MRSKRHSHITSDKLGATEIPQPTNSRLQNGTRLKSKSFERDDGASNTWKTTMTDKTTLLEQRVPIVRKHKKRRPKNWRHVLRQKGKQSRKTRAVTLGQRRKR